MTDHRRQPNLFIGGAPKTGTTAIANYLRTHPQVFVCEPKEPYFWATDMPGMRADMGFKNRDDYDQLFASATSGHRAIAEGSTLYLLSTDAIPAIMRENPSAKFVFGVRNPVEVAHAYHMQMVYYEQDDEPDFASAWRLQDRRRDDAAAIPKRCLHPGLLQYRNVAAMGSQLHRMFQCVPREQVHLILFDDFKIDPATAYAELLSFLDLPHDGRTEFPKENAAMRAKHPGLTRWMRTKAVRRTTWWIKQRLSGPVFSIAKKIKNSATYTNASRESLSGEMRAELDREFQPEIEKLQEILGRDLSHWSSSKPV